MSWLTPDHSPSLALNLRTIPAAAGLVGRRHRRHRRRRRRVRVGAVDRRGLPAAMRDSGSPAPRARDAQRRRQRDDERPRRAGGRRHQAGARHRRDGQMPARVGRAVRHHRPAEEVDAGRRPTCRCAASSRRRSPCATRSRSSRAGCSSSARTRSSSAAARSGQFAGLNVGDDDRVGAEPWQVVGIFEADGGVAETEIWCDARALQGAYRRGNTLPVRARAARLARLVRHRSRTG